MSFNHYILTRFSIPCGMLDDKKLYDPVYLAQRMTLFEGITLPSVRSQTSQNFVWYIIIHETLPAETKARLEKVLTGNANYKIHVVNSGIFWKSSIIDEINRIEGSDKNTHRLFSRLDDDDAMTVGTVESIQKNVSLSMDYQILYVKNCSYYNPSNDLILPVNDPQITPAIMQSVLVNRAKYPNLSVYHINHREMLLKKCNEMLQKESSGVTYISGQATLYTMHDFKHSNLFRTKFVRFVDRHVNRKIYGLPDSPVRMESASRGAITHIEKTRSAPTVAHTPTSATASTRAPATATAGPRPKPKVKKRTGSRVKILSRFSNRLPKSK